MWGRQVLGLASAWRLEGDSCAGGLQSASEREAQLVLRAQPLLPLMAAQQLPKRAAAVVPESLAQCWALWAVVELAWRRAGLRGMGETTGQRGTGAQPHDLHGIDL